MNLEDLSLFNNRITKIDSLDSLVKLQVLSLGNNQIGNMMNVSVQVAGPGLPPAGRGGARHYSWGSGWGGLWQGERQA